MSNDEKISQNDVEMVEGDKSSDGSPESTFLTEEERLIEKKMVSKMDWRLLPTTAIIYLLCYLDRSNIGNAKILNADTGDSIQQTNNMSNYQFTVALMLFLVAYCIFEAPSNIALKWASPKKWMGFLTVSFGTFCTLIAVTNNAEGVTALRFMLGAAEAGVFPGMIYYFSFWYKAEERASRIAAFLCSATLSGAFGGTVAYGVGHMNKAGGLEAWRWLFILEGVPAVICGILVFFFLPNYPETASWLTDEEKRVQARRMGIHGAPSKEKMKWEDAKATLLDFRLYFHYLAYMGLGSGVASLSLFSPTIVQGLGYAGLNAQLYSVPPYAVAYVVTLVAAWLSDRWKTRGLVAGISFTIGAICFIVLAALPGASFTARYVLLIFATSGVFGGLPSLCAWVGDNSRTTTAGGLSTALNIAFSGPGQIAGVWIYRAQDAPFYRLGHGVNAGFVTLAAVCSFGLTIYYRRKNAKMVGTNMERWIT